MLTGRASSSRKIPAPWILPAIRCLLNLPAPERTIARSCHPRPRRSGSNDVVTLLCPACGQRIEVLSPADPPQRCPHCGAMPVTPPLAVPSWFPESRPPPDGSDVHTFQAGDQPTQVNTPAPGFPFLAPPRGPNEVGW